MNKIPLVRHEDSFIKDDKSVELPTMPTYYHYKRKWWQCRFYILSFLLKPFRQAYLKFLHSETIRCKKEYWYWRAICTKTTNLEEKK